MADSIHGIDLKRFQRGPGKRILRADTRRACAFRLLMMLLLGAVILVRTPSTAPAARHALPAYSPVLIHDIQGAGLSSPYAGRTCTLSGIVVGDFQKTLGGFFLQEEDADADADSATSEGLYVYYRRLNVDVGDKVRVTGKVTEFYELTELTKVVSLTVISTGNPLPAPARLTLPFDSRHFAERYEGMRTTNVQTLHVTDNEQLGRYGTVTLSAGGRLYQPTQTVSPGVPAARAAANNTLNRILLDDGRKSVYPNPIAFVPGGTAVTADASLRCGAAVSSGGISGVLTHAFGEYRLYAVSDVVFSASANPRPALPPRVGGRLKVAAVNLQNFFVSIGAGNTCGPRRDQNCRGADSKAEWIRQRKKIITMLDALDADIVGLIEVENHPQDAALDDLIAGLNAVSGKRRCVKVNSGPMGGHAIKVALVYDRNTVAASAGGHAVLDSTADPGFNDAQNRPTLAQTFSEIATGRKLTVAVNHFRSKGADCRDIGDPDAGDGQGNCRQTRKNAAAALIRWLASDPTGSGTANVLIIGDLNCYAQEEPIAVISAAGYTDLIARFNGTEAYSYIFNGQAGCLDHLLAGPALLPKVTGAAPWHINADEPDIIGYDLEPPNSLYRADPFRASDHDPVIVGLDL